MSNQAYTTSDEKYVYLASSDGQFISVYDIQNISDPFFLQSIFIDKEQGYRLVTSKQNKFAIMLTQKGVRVIPQTTPIMINSEFFLFDKQLQDFVTIDQKRGFFVGETVKIIFSVIGFPQTKKIRQVQLLLNQNVISLPSWIQFNERSLSLSINVDKEGIGKQQIILKCLIQVFAEDFTNNLNQQLFEQLKVDGYLDGLGFLTNKFSTQETLVLDSPSVKDQQNYASTVLNQKFFYVPSLINIKKSLFFDPQSKDLILKSLSSNIQVILQVSENDGVFMKQSYQGVLAEYSPNLNIISMRGSYTQLNEQLNNIRFSQYNISKNNINITYIIDDGINYLIKNTVNISALPFIKKNHLVEVIFPLQKQLDKIYEDGQIYIEEEFSFVYSTKTFYDEDDLKFQAFYKNSLGKLVEVKDSEFFEFNVNERSFTGKTKQKMFKNKYTFVVTASDGYSSASSEFSIECTLFPVMFIISYIGYLAGPLISIIGAISNRFPLFHIFCKKKYVYSPKVLQKGQEIDLTYILIQEQKEVSDEIWKNFDKSTFAQNYIENSELQENKIIEIVLSNYANNEQIMDKIKKSQKSVLLMTIARANQFFIESNQSYQNVYQEIIQQSITQKKLHYKDYYLNYINIQKHQFKEDQLQKYFPTLIINTNNFIQNFEMSYNIHLKDFNPTNQFDNNKNIFFDLEDNNRDITIERLANNCPSINYKIILKQIIYDALGLSQFEFLESSRGISIDNSKVEIQMIKMYRKTNDSPFLPKLFSFLKLNYVPIELSGNRSMPLWIKAEITKHCIHITGKPTSFDKGEYQLRITNIQQFIVIELPIEVVCEEEQPNDESSNRNFMNLESNSKSSQTDQQIQQEKQAYEEVSKKLRQQIKQEKQFTQTNLDYNTIEIIQSKQKISILQKETPNDLESQLDSKDNLLQVSQNQQKEPAID